MPERSRGWTRNALGSARRGSNPLGVARSTAMDLWTALHAQFTAEQIGRFSGGGCTGGHGLQHQEIRCLGITSGMPKKVPTGMVGQVQKGLDDCACNTSLKPLQRMWRSVFTDSAAAQAEGEYCVVGLVGAIDTVPEWSRG